jgi:anti-sigma factor RsiW
MDQFDDCNEFGESPERAPACAVCENLLPDAVDGLLSGAELSAFDRHVAACQECADELAEARRGAAWLSMLKSQAPKPPDSLLARILAETSGAEQTAAAVVIHHSSTQPAMRPVIQPVIQPAAVARFTPRPQTQTSPWMLLRRQLQDIFSVESARATFQPRIAMTAAMAFFSIALTLNLTGVRLRDLRPSNFTPSALKRSIADLDATATRRFQNNRAVYQVESRLSELRDDGVPGQPDADR